MATRRVTCFVAVCDLCGSTRQSDDYTPHLDSPEEAVQYAVDSGLDEHDGWTLTREGVLVCDQSKDAAHEDAHGEAGKRMGNDAMRVVFATT
ncbi:hypothetical protein ACWGQ4_06245 [Streptomyces sp. NPDC055721]|uniref:hypothetical protein n=1 Tax=Streptomyces sp. NPDC127132 TaxID=3345374 RepID=UPI0036393410